MSPLSPRGRYQKGRRLEYRTMRFYEAQGYSTFRMAGSHSPFDVIAISGNHIILAQVKGGTADLSPVELEKIELFRAPSVCTKVLVRWPDRASQPVIKEIV